MDHGRPGREGRRQSTSPWGLPGSLLAPVLRALTAALAAGTAWAAVQPWGGLADQFPYYAPLGAVIAVSGSLAASARGAVTTVRNLVIGAFLGSAAHLIGAPDVVGLALVVGVATLLQWLPRLSAGSPWVAYSAVFVLVVGGDEPWVYGAAYAGLTSFGALVGLAVTWAVPPLLLGPTGRTIRATGDALASQLDDLAEALTWDDPPTADEWVARRHALAPALRALDDAVAASTEARRGNWRARRWAGSTGHQAGQAALVHATAPLVAHLTLVLSHDERADRQRLALGVPLRPPTAAALTAWAESLRTATDGGDTGDAVARLGTALDDLAAGVREQARDAPDLFTAGAVVSTVRRGLELLTDD